MRCILQVYDLTGEYMFTEVLVLKKFLLSILKFLEADNTVSGRRMMMDGLDHGL